MHISYNFLKVESCGKKIFLSKETRGIVGNRALIAVRTSAGGLARPSSPPHVARGQAIHR